MESDWDDGWDGGWAEATDGGDGSSDFMLGSAHLYNSGTGYVPADPWASNHSVHGQAQWDPPLTGDRHLEAAGFQTSKKAPAPPETPRWRPTPAVSRSTKYPSTESERSSEIVAGLVERKARRTLPSGDQLPPPVVRRPRSAAQFRVAFNLLRSVIADDPVEDRLATTARLMGITALQVRTFLGDDRFDFRDMRRLPTEQRNDAPLYQAARIPGTARPTPRTAKSSEAPARYPLGRCPCCGAQVSTESTCQCS
jgi:hypothetical protein